MIQGLTKEHWEEFKEQQKLISRGHLIRFCSRCQQFHQVQLGFTGFDVCHNCISNP